MPKFNFSKAKQEEFLGHVRGGVQRGAAADAINLSRRKVREYIEEHPDFEEAVLDAEVDATEHVLEALYQAAASGSVAAAKAWLELKGQMPQRQPQEHGQAPGDTPPDDAFADLDNVAPLDPRRRARS